MKRRSPRKGSRRKIWPFALAFAPLLLWAGLVGTVNLSTRSFVYSEAAAVPVAPVGIVLGAGVLKSGKPSLVLQQRLDGAIELYRSHKISRILMSGDNRTTHYNEPRAMRAYALKHHVEDAKIDLDYAGRDTYDTCYRAKHVFGIDKAIFITQQYHAPRAVYLGRSIGIDAVAYGVQNLSQYPAAQFGFNLREMCADVKAVWDASVSHRKPYVALEREKERFAYGNEVRTSSISSAPGSGR